MLLVTGAAGFIGSNFVKYLNSKGFKNIFISDYLTNGKQFKNLNNCFYRKFITPDRVARVIDDVDFVFHFGAISNTTEWNGELILEKNYNYTIDLIDLCNMYEIPISYSSSASVYGNGSGPLNLYAYSKLLIDQEVEEKIKTTKSKIQGFRYFNVYGQNEWHKGDQASPYYVFEKQAKETGKIKIFEGSENFKRDFVDVNTVCEIQYKTLFAYGSGIYDLGSGKQKSFRDVAEEISKKYSAKIEEIPFPENLKNHYQFNTLANMDYVLEKKYEYDL